MIYSNFVRLCLCAALFAAASAQTPITDGNIHAAVDACLAEDPQMNCPGTEYGRAADWDTSSVTNMAFLLARHPNRGTMFPGTGVPYSPDNPTILIAQSEQFHDTSVFANWDTSATTNVYGSAPPSSQHTCSNVWTHRLSTMTSTQTC